MGHRKKHPHARSKESRKQREASDIVLKGLYSATSGGYGFVCPEEDGPDIFIPARYTGTAMDGDLVEVKIAKDDYTLSSGRGPTGKIKKVLTRARTHLVGELIHGKKVRPLNRKIPDDISVAGKLRGASKGDWVSLNLFPGKNSDKINKGEIHEVIGRAGSIENDIRAVINEYELEPPYTADEDADAARIVPRDMEREDLTGLFCVTIDPADAKDYDDAISLREGTGKNSHILEIGVHIADVAAWVKPGTKWDKEARLRAFTAYLPGKTLPMLPPALTRLISLSPEKDSKAHSVILYVNCKTGKVIGSKRFHSVIRVTERLSFDDVQSFIEGKAPEKWSDEFRSSMRTLVNITKKMREYRAATEKFLEMSIPEVRVICDFEKGTVIGLEHREQRQADTLVEDCMLAANTETAKELIVKKIPGIFRIHPEPDSEKLEDFYAFINKTFDMNPGDLSSRSACNHFLENLSDGPEKTVILSHFLRSLPRASYLEENQFHFGLGKGRYCHFTSPIRRYPDLVVHQQFWAADSGGRLKSGKTMAKTARDCSSREEKNDEAYYSANDRLKLKYLQQENSKDESRVYEGMITKISSAGLVVDITELGIYGFVPVELLRGHFRYSKKEAKLNAVRGGQNYKCGNFIYLYLDRIDFIKASAMFRPAVEFG